MPRIPTPEHNQPFWSDSRWVPLHTPSHFPPPSTEPWIFNADLGIIHHNGECRPCRSYRNHVIKAMDDDHSPAPDSFRAAYDTMVDAMVDDMDLDFEKGLQIGRQEAERRLVGAYSHKLDRAQRRYEEAQEQLQKKCQELDKLRVAYETLGSKRPLPRGMMVKLAGVETGGDREVARSAPTSFSVLEHPIPSLRLVSRASSSSDAANLPNVNATRATLINPGSHTRAQKFLLPNLMRSPSPESINSTPMDRSSVVDPVYVDASRNAIGFVFRDKWQIWELSESWQEPRLREIQWAEAVAVELGIRLMISAGYFGRAISICSDNRQVVDAVAKISAIRNSEVMDVIQTIHDLCEEFSIDLRILWIPGEVNFADGPSRFNTGYMQRFERDIGIPAHLREFVLPFQVPDAW